MAQKEHYQVVNHHPKSHALLCNDGIFPIRQSHRYGWNILLIYQTRSISCHILCGSRVNNPRNVILTMKTIIGCRNIEDVNKLLSLYWSDAKYFYCLTM